MIANVLAKRAGLLLALNLFVPVISMASDAERLCDSLLSDKRVSEVFKQSALKQLTLEFGGDANFVYDIIQSSVDDDLVRVEAFARYPKPGQKELARMRLNAWVSRCTGTTIIRGNTWLANGDLEVKRYSEQELKGRGLAWGRADAPLRFIIYVDSRCPHCHRLIDYARKLVEAGKVFLDIRQVAYLEDIKDAISDTQLPKTQLIVKNTPSVNDESYLQMLGGENSEEELLAASLEYKQALDLISENTATAEKILYIITVPGVLIQEKDHQNLYRKMGYWEINRIFQ